MHRVKNLIRDFAPFGLVERHRRRFQLGRLGLPGSNQLQRAVETCRFEHWPMQLRQAAKPWTLVDVGAHFGEFTVAAARLANLAEVHAFEPQPRCQARLQQALGRIPRAHLHPVAVGAQAGEVEFLCMANPRMSSVLSPEPKVIGAYGPGDFTLAQRIKVPQVRLDDVIPPGTEIGLLKIDVQGSELSVLAGASVTLRSTFAVLIEVCYVAHYRGGATFDAVHETLRDHGFRTFGISAPYAAPEEPLWADAMFCRETGVRA